MDKFVEIYKEITNELNTCNHKWLELRDLLNKTDPEDKPIIEGLSLCLVKCEERFFSAKRLYEKINSEGDVIANMLDGFCFTPYCHRSFVYPNIYEYFYGEDKGKAYFVEDKTFYNLDEAKDYAKSLGVNKDWKDKVYQYLGVKLES